MRNERESFHPQALETRRIKMKTNMNTNRVRWGWRRWEWRGGAYETTTTTTTATTTMKDHRDAKRGERENKTGAGH